MSNEPKGMPQDFAEASTVNLGTIDYELNIKLKFYESAYVFLFGLFVGSIAAGFTIAAFIGIGNICQ